MAQRLVPMIAYDDTAAAADWLSQAFAANVIRPPEEGPAGRLFTAEDLEGHRWMFQQR